MSARPVQIAEHKFPHDGWVAAALGVRVDEIARRNGLTVDVWEEDGLGEAKGCFLQLGSGQIIMLRELTHAVERLGEKGANVLVDAADLVLQGGNTISREVAAALGLSREEVVRVADAADEAAAGRFVLSFGGLKRGD